MSIFKKEKKQPESIKEILSRFEKLQENFKKVSSELEKLKEENKFSIQKLALIRFNPFREVGGDQSFSMAVLDANDDGAIITSHYTRNENRIYGKPLKGGKSEYPLSDEEVRAIEMARSQKTNGK
jgi:hypothetical protein